MDWCLDGVELAESVSTKKTIGQTIGWSGSGEENRREPEKYERHKEARKIWMYIYLEWRKF
jgi:hypothetical protein